MSKEFFEDVVFTVSRDVNIDKGWTEIRTTTGSRADMEIIFKALSDLYWEGVRYEVAAAISALAEFDEYQMEALPIERQREDHLGSENLTGLLDLWNPFDNGQWPTNITIPKPSVENIRVDVEANVAKFFAQETLRKRRARSLLQALGLMDIDFVREHRQPTFRSWGQRPQVQEDKPLLMARQCSDCRHCIRSFHFYECRKGCLDSEHPRNMAHIKPIRKDTNNGVKNNFDMDNLLHTVAITNMMHGNQPYRLCPACLMSSSHPREHLRAVRGFSKGGDREVMEFARELDIWEDHLDGRSLLSFGSIALDKLAMASPSLNRTSSRHFFPAGNTHCAVMFGPLLIENGVTRNPGGALLSRRTIPNFTTSTSTDLIEFLAQPSDWQFYNSEEVVHNTIFSVSADRRLYSATKPVRERRFMSSRKQVLGGLFTGFCNQFVNDEENILAIFMESAELWKLTKEQDATQGEHRATLTELASRVTGLIKLAFEFEINKFLLSFASRLHKLSKLQYNRISNNCQDFCNAMLLNSDKWDILFKYSYPLIPADRDHEADDVQLRYLMSFAGRMIHPMEDTPFVNPLVSSIQLYDSFGQNDADLIDHITSIRLKEDPDGHGFNFKDLSHDEFLLKDGTFTCPKEDYDGKGKKPQKPCTTADHLLDGPHDNISVLTLHIHRQRNLYTVPSSEPFYDEFLSTKGPSEWIYNRLEVLHRLLLLNTYLAQIACSFQSSIILLPYKQLKKSWTPPSSFFARAWHVNKRNMNNLIRPTWQAALENDSTMTTLVALHTHPFMQAPDIWKSRLTAIKRRLLNESKDQSGLFKQMPWINCECNDCLYSFAQQNCWKAASYITSQNQFKGGEIKFMKCHPDYVSFEQLRASIETLGVENPVVINLLQLLESVPEYLNAQ